MLYCKALPYWIRDFSSRPVCRLAPCAVQKLRKYMLDNCHQLSCNWHGYDPCSLGITADSHNNRCQCWKLRHKVVGHETNWLRGSLCNPLNARPSHSARNQACR